MYYINKKDNVLYIHDAEHEVNRYGEVQSDEDAYATCDTLEELYRVVGQGVVRDKVVSVLFQYPRA